MTPKQALALAAERKLHLVEVAPNASPPVWKLLATLPVVEKRPEPPKIEEMQARIGGSKRQQEKQRAALRRKPRAANEAKPQKVKEIRLSDKCEVGSFKG